MAFHPPLVKGGGGDLALLPAPLHLTPAPRGIVAFGVRVTARPHPFREANEVYWFPPGLSLAGILARVQPDPWLRQGALIWLDDEPVAPEHWEHTYPAWGAEVAINVAPAGKAARVVGSIFVAIAAIAVAALVMWAIGPAAYPILAPVMGGLAGMVTGIVGNMALNALMPPTANPSRLPGLMGTAALSSPYGNNVADSPAYSLSGASNQANKYGPIPKIYGRIKHFPGYGASTYTEAIGDEQHLYLYFIWAVSRAGTPALQIESLKIGDTALSNFTQYQCEHRNLVLKLTEQTIAIDVTAKTLTRTAGSWISEGFKTGMTLTLGGCTTPANNTTYVLSQVTALVLTWSESTATTTEAGTGEQTVLVTFGDDPITLYPKSMHEEAETILLEQNQRQVRTAQEDATKITFDITFANGLYATDPGSGAKQTKVTFFKFEYRESPAGEWHTIVAAWAVSAATSSTVRRGYDWTPPGAGPYDIGITRLTGPDDSFSMSVSYWTSLRSFFQGEPVVCNVPLAKTVLKIKASNEFQGTVDKFSGVCSGIMPDWDKDTATWITRISQNPASCFREAHQGPQLQDPFLDAELDLAGLEDWAEFCEEEGFKYNRIVDSDMDLSELAVEIAAVGRANPDWPDSQRSVIIGRPQDFTIGPAFTPRNSKNYSFQIVYPDPVHAWRCPFKNELNDWLDDERVVPMDGYALLDPEGNKIDAWGDPAPDLPLATIIVQLPLIGSTHPDLIFRHALFHGAQVKLQFVKYQFDAFLDQLVARRGNRSKHAHDVILAGSSWGRVKVLVAGEPPEYLGGVQVDADCPMVEGKTYCVRFRLANNVSVLCNVVTVAGKTRELTFSESLPPYDPGPPPNTPWPAVGDLFMFGESGKEAIDLLLYAVRPNNSLGATLTAVDYDANLYLADQGTVPPHDPQVTAPPAWGAPMAAWVRSGGDVLWQDNDGSWRSRILISLAIPGDLEVGIIGVEAQYWPTGSNAAPTTLPMAPLADWEVSLMPVEDGVEYSYRLRYIKKDGSQGPWTETQSHVVQGKTAPPADVSGFGVWQIREAVNFGWVKNPDRDIQGYILSFGEVGVAWNDATYITEVMLGTAFSTPLIPPGTWDFLIKAVDTTGNLSETEARKTFNVVEFYQVISDLLSAPGWQGTLINMVRNSRTGILNPESQDPPDADNDDWIDYYCHNPFSEYGFEGSEVDLGSQDWYRLWARIYSHLGPGEGGKADPQLLVATKPEGGEYGDWQSWKVGMVECRYAKFKALIDPEVGIAGLTEFERVADKSY